jgi:N-acyl-L-homoserine lactone synthetase
VVKVNFCQTPVEVACKNAIAHLDDLRSASTRVSDLLEKVNEQEWRNNHVIHRNIHSVLLILIVSVVLICLLFKLYTVTRRWMPTCLCRKEAPTTPMGVSHVLGPDNQENVAISSNISNENSPNVAKPTPVPPFKASQPCVATSLF